jgi:CheY-like chemotaxis protein
MGGRLDGLRVLIVEDELLVAMELEDLLGRLGCRVVEAAPTVGRALRAVERQQPDVAVLDVNLHGERVTPVADALREHGVPFVLVTSYGRDRLPEGTLRAAPCLPKPVDREQIASALAAVVAAPPPAAAGPPA